MEKHERYDYDLVIVGAGVSGAAQFFAASRYTRLSRVALIEKEASAGRINSKPTNNSQTLHEGDIETNYDLEKATSVKHKASFTRSYVEKKNNQTLYIKSPKMVFGIGEREYQILSSRFEAFKELYPTLERLERAELSVREPKMFEGRERKERVIGLYNRDGITIDYGRLAASMVEDAENEFGKTQSRTGTVYFNTRVKSITKDNEGYAVDVGDRKIRARFVSFCTGAHSLYFAKMMRIKEAERISLLSIAGNFYYIPKYLNSKVYTVQTPGLPFSAVHGDPDILNPDKTRFGPTTRIVFLLERHKWNTFGEYVMSLRPFLASLLAYIRIMSNRIFVLYAIRHNVLFLLPIVGNFIFVHEARKIIPSLKYSELTRAKEQGGIRPQIVQTDKKNPLNLGEAKLTGHRVLFNITPSPGASTCVYNGLVDVQTIARSLGVSFDEQRLVRDFGRSLQ